MADDNFEEKVKALRFSSGKGHMTIEEMATIQPGLGRLMPEVGARTWKLFYAAREKNWPMAKFQYKEVRSLLKLCAFVRPKYKEPLDQFLEADWAPLEAAINNENFPTFEKLFHRAVKAANGYHNLLEKAYIRWKLPDAPPPDLDLRPRK